MTPDMIVIPGTNITLDDLGVFMLIAMATGVFLALVYGAARMFHDRINLRRYSYWVMGFGALLAGGCLFIWHLVSQQYYPWEGWTQMIVLSILFFIGLSGCGLGLILFMAALIRYRGGRSG